MKFTERVAAALADGRLLVDGTHSAASTSSAADVDTSDQADALRHAVRAVRAPLDEAPAVADSATRASSTGSYLAALHEGMREFDAERGRRDAP